MRRPDRIALAALFVLLAASRCGAHASAQSDELLVARICLSEAPRDCTAISAVLSERAVTRGTTVRVVACSYAPRSCGRLPYVRRPWLPLAHPDRGAPIGWPGVSSWERTRTLLASLTVVAWRALRGIEPTPCVGATEWASPHCVACLRRMRRAGYERVDCVSSNAFWRAPQGDGPWSGANAPLMCGGGL